MDCADPFAHELPVRHAIRAVLLHGLRAFVTYEGDKDQPGDQDERQDHTDKPSKGEKEMERIIVYSQSRFYTLFPYQIHPN